MSNIGHRGLRGYLWSQKSEEAKVFRELFYLNGTYIAYRNFIANAKEVGFPDQLRVSRHLTEDADGPIERSGASVASSKTSSSEHPPIPYVFSGADASVLVKEWSSGSIPTPRSNARPFPLSLVPQMPC